MGVEREQDVVSSLTVQQLRDELTSGCKYFLSRTVRVWLNPSPVPMLATQIGL